MGADVGGVGVERSVPSDADPRASAPIADSAGAGVPGASQPDTGADTGADGTGIARADGGGVIGGTRHPDAGAGIHVPVDACNPGGSL